VRDGDDPERSARIDEDLVRARGTERSDSLAAQVLQRAEACAVRDAHREHFAELEIRNADGMPLAERRPVFHARHADVEVAALDGRLDLRPRDLHEAWRAAPT